MKQSHLLSKIISSALFLLLFVATACVDDKYDLSKDIDMTVGVGGGVSLPLGSTEKIMLTELIDTVETDIVKLDNEGNYSIFKEGNFTPESFQIDNMDISIDAAGESKHYDFNLYNLSEDYDKLPIWVQQEIQKKKYPYVVHHKVDHRTAFDVEQSVPQEMVRLRALNFRNDVTMAVNVRIYSKNHQSDDMLKIVDRLRLNSEVGEGFLLNVPEYIVFEDKSIVDGHLFLSGEAVYNSTTKSLEYNCKYNIEGLDFSKYKNGYLPVENGTIVLHDTLNAVGYVDSDTVFFAFDNITHIQSVDFEVTMSINKMTVESVEGIFAPEIDPIKEVVDLDLGDDLDFLDDSYLDFNDPRLFVTFTNPVDARMFADARFAGYDKSGNKIENSDVAVNLVLEGNRENNLLISRYATELPGYTTYLAPTLNNLIKTIPDRIDVNVETRMDNSEYSTIVLGRSFGISGSYQVSLPLVFDEFTLVYTEEIDDVLGDDPSEVTDYVTDINSVTLAFEILNTVPAEFTPSIVAYDKNGRRLAGIKVDVVGAIAAGNGMAGAAVTEPVSSNIEINLSALNGELEELDKLDLKFEGRGSGRLNSNEYIQLKDINVTVNEDIVVDLN